MDLLTPMCNFGVYSEAGDFLYGNFSVKYIDDSWDNYRKGKIQLDYQTILLVLRGKKKY